MRKRRTRFVIIVIVALGLLPLNWNFAFAATGSPPATVPAMGNPAQNLPPVLDANGQPVSPGTLPTSPFYWLANIVQHIQLFLTFDPAQKVSLTEHQTLQKLAAAREMVQEGKMDIAQTELNNYMQNATATQTMLTRINPSNSQTVQTLQNAIAKADAANIQVLSQMLDQLPQQAARKIALNILNSMKKDAGKLGQDKKNKPGNLVHQQNSTPEIMATGQNKNQNQPASPNVQPPANQAQLTMPTEHSAGDKNREHHEDQQQGKKDHRDGGDSEDD